MSQLKLVPKRLNCTEFRFKLLGFSDFTIKTIYNAKFKSEHFTRFSQRVGSSTMAMANAGQPPPSGSPAK
eukprot:scaffold7529_cov153-Skeletonema_marinoi.AAC.2